MARPTRAVESCSYHLKFGEGRSRGYLRAQVAIEESCRLRDQRKALTDQRAPLSGPLIAEEFAALAEKVPPPSPPQYRSERAGVGLCAAPSSPDKRWSPIAEEERVG